MSPHDVHETQSIARLRVHVERCIRRVKENKLFDRVLPVSVCGIIDELFNVACYLVPINALDKNTILCIDSKSHHSMPVIRSCPCTCQ
ncbi:hypothetical protein CRENBAI_010322 [Crenichthys baileyi]|uniref:DDE Tnp4 domain-containing protein n=1 Tax=Crenichthys baileyi TaxID=28760 RepID=A0AAV9R6S7_9TELE